MNAGRVKSGTGHVACSVARCCRCVKTAAPIDDDDDVVWGGGCKMLPLREVRAYVDVMDQVADDLS